MIKRMLVGAALVTLPAAVSAQQSDIVQVLVIASRGSAATVIASPQPYFESGPVAKMYLPSGTDARTRDGRPIVGFEFTAWTEGDATRGQVFALVPASGSPNVDFRYRADLGGAHRQLPAAAGRERPDYRDAQPWARAHGRAGRDTARDRCAA